MQTARSIGVDSASCDGGSRPHVLDAETGKGAAQEALEDLDGRRQQAVGGPGYAARLELAHIRSVCILL